jgi:translation initiation factor IF-3
LSKTKLYWRVNEQIHAPEVRVIGQDGKQVGIKTIKKALTLAKKAKLDLVEIAPKAKPPVVKIIDIGKFRYHEEKKLRREKRKSKASELKEVRFSPFIAENDYKTRLERVGEFLKQRNKVKVVVVFKGRHMGSKPFGYKLLDKILANIENEVNIDMKPKFLGRHLTMVISPLTKSKKAEEPRTMVKSSRGKQKSRRKTKK